MITGTAGPPTCTGMARGEDLAAEYAGRGDHHMLVTALSTTETMAWAAHSGDLPAIDPAQG